jgi:hypothetical protein
MNLRLYVLLAFLAALASSACGGGAQSSPTVPAAIATELPVATPPVNVHPSGTRIGMASIDAALDAIERRDAARLTSQLAVVSATCTNEPVYPGYALPCGPGQAGTTIDIIVYNRCRMGESQIVLRSDAAPAVAAFIADRPSGLVSVTRMGTSPYDGPYGVAFASGHTILLDDTGVTTLMLPCPGVPVGPPPLGPPYILPPP